MSKLWLFIRNATFNSILKSIYYFVQLLTSKDEPILLPHKISSLYISDRKKLNARNQFIFQHYDYSM